MGRTPIWKTAAFLVVLSAVFCAPLFTNFGNWGRQDWDQFTYRYETPRTAILRDHVLPTWNPYSSGGTVLLAHPNSPVLSPWYAIVLTLGGSVGLRVQVFVFMALGAIGMALLAGRLGASTAGSIAGGVAFMMSSHFALHITEGHLEWCVLGLMPWLALCVLRFNDGWRHVILAALLLASVLLFGSVYIPAVFLPFFSAWILMRTARERQSRTLVRWVAAVGIAAMLASAKLVPMISFTSDWPRPLTPDLHRTTPRLLLAGLFDPRQTFVYQASRDRDLPDGHVAKVIPNAVASPIVGSLDAMGAATRFHEYGAYIGLAGILLAVCGAVRSFRRLWPLYVAGAISVIVVLGDSAPLNLWWAMRKLPLYHQLQVPSRFLAPVVFVLSVAVALGMTAFANALRGSAARWRGAAEICLVAALFAELGVQGWKGFRDVFVVPPAPFEHHSDFAHRFVVPSVVPVVMGSTMSGFLKANSGTLDAYENVSVRRAAVRTPTDSLYRGETYLQSGSGTARISAWTMSRVRVTTAPSGADTLVLNQNFYHGWMARIRSVSGEDVVVPATSSAGGLIAVAVGREHSEVEFFYVARGFSTGVWLSAIALVACLAGLRFIRAVEA